MSYVSFRITWFIPDKTIFSQNPSPFLYQKNLSRMNKSAFVSYSYVKGIKSFLLKWYMFTSLLTFLMNLNISTFLFLNYIIFLKIHYCLVTTVSDILCDPMDSKYVSFCLHFHQSLLAMFIESMMVSNYLPLLPPQFSPVSGSFIESVLVSGGLSALSFILLNSLIPLDWLFWL